MSEFKLGRHEALIEGLDRRMSAVETTVVGFDKKLDDVLAHLAEKRGERKTLIVVASVASAVVSTIIAVVKALAGRS